MGENVSVGDLRVVLAGAAPLPTAFRLSNLDPARIIMPINVVASIVGIVVAEAICSLAVVTKIETAAFITNST